MPRIVEIVTAALAIRIGQELAADCAADVMYALRHAGYSVAKRRKPKAPRKKVP